MVYTCFNDMFGCAGLLDRRREIIKSYSRKHGLNYVQRGNLRLVALFKSDSIESKSSETDVAKKENGDKDDSESDDEQSGELSIIQAGILEECKMVSMIWRT